MCKSIFCVQSFPIQSCVAKVDHLLILHIPNIPNVSNHFPFPILWLTISTKPHAIQLMIWDETSVDI